MRPPSSVVIISTLTMSVPILISLVCILHCSMLGGVEMGRGPGLAGSDGLSQWTTPVVQFLPSCLGEPVAFIQAPSLCHSSAATTAAAPARAFNILGFLSPTVMPSSDAPSNPSHSLSHMANASTTSSLA